MPEISRFLGMVIQMYFNEHNPPNFHVQYNEYQAAILIENLGVMEGELPAKALSLVVEWGQEHQEELLANWNSLRKSGQFHKIQPLA
tara:strand:+ start:921 stop:1181 length:261 start_codon:yes stop_codon:yes gene_type:complete